jgi:hypothetical protein
MLPGSLAAFEHDRYKLAELMYRISGVMDVCERLLQVSTAKA